MAAAEHLPSFAPTLEGLERGAAALRVLLDMHGVPATARNTVELAFDEIVGNIVRHARATGDVQVAITLDEREIVLAIEDDGVPFNPCDQPDPAQPSSLNEARVGGLGLPLLRRFLARMQYERTPRHNRLTIGIPAQAV